MNIDASDKFKAPPPTESELKLRNILKSKNIPFKHSQLIWYTGCDKYTPDLIIGEKLIIEVEGKIHDKEFLKTPDRSGTLENNKGPLLDLLSIFFAYDYLCRDYGYPEVIRYRKVNEGNKN